MSGIWFFAVKEGKATNITSRLLISGVGRVYQYLNGNYSKLVPQKINEYLKENYEIDYCDTSFSKATHRLAFAELQSITEYQKSYLSCIECTQILQYNKV